MSDSQSVVVPASIGGSGNTYSTVSGVGRSLAGDGHRQWFIPLLQEIINICLWMVTYITGKVADITGKVADITGYNTAAQNAATSANASANSAASSAATASAAVTGALIMQYRNALVAYGGMPGWDCALSGASNITPDQAVYSRGSEKIKVVFTWVSGKITKSAFWYSADSGASYSKMSDGGKYVITYNYDGAGAISGLTWGAS